MEISKGSPQGSLMGPMAYNIHSNDLFYFIMNLCDVFNYADDNTVGCIGDTMNDVKQKLENVSRIMFNWFDVNHMKANPSKFQYIVFQHSSIDTVMNMINVNGVSIESQSCVKLLGVHIDNQLKFSRHISELCAKAGRKMNVIARLSNLLRNDSKMLLYNSFVMSHLSYCPIIWHYSSRSDMLKLEKLQYRALKYIDRDFTASYAMLRKRYDKPLLYVSRLRSIVYEVFKCIQGINPSYLNVLFSMKEHKYNTRHSNLNLPKYNYVKHGKNSFRYNGCMLWNALEDFRNVHSVTSFKKMLRQWDGPKCNCSYCEMCTLNNM